MRSATYIGDLNKRGPRTEPRWNLIEVKESGTCRMLYVRLTHY